MSFSGGNFSPRSLRIQYQENLSLSLATTSSKFWNNNPKVSVLINFMYRLRKSYSVLAFLFLALLDITATAQSLVLRQRSQQFSLEATAPPQLGFRIQAGPDLETWEDI